MKTLLSSLICLTLLIPATSIQAENIFIPNANEYYIVSSIQNNLVLDIKGGSNDDNTPAILWQMHGGSNQQWKFAPISERGYYNIISRKNDKCLDISHVNSESPVLVIKTKINTDSQKWKITAINANGIQIISKVNGYVIAIKNANDENGSEVIINRNTNLSSQKWRLKSIQSIEAFKEAQKLYKQAEVLYYKKKYNEALILYQKAVQLAPDYGEAIRDIGLIYEKFKNYNKALQFLLKAAMLMPDNPWVYSYIAINYSAINNTTKAIENYDKAINVIKKLNLKVPAWILINVSYQCLKKLIPIDYNRAIYYAKVIYDGDYEREHKNKALELIAEAYYLQKNLSNALYYAKLRGKDYHLTKALLPRTIICTISLNLNKLMKTCYSWVKPGIISINLPINTEYQSFISLVSTPRHKEIRKEGRVNYAVFDFSKGFPANLKMVITMKNQLIDMTPDSLSTFDRSDDEAGYFANLSNDYYDLNNPVLKNLVHEITKNHETLKDKVLAIYKWIGLNIKYGVNRTNKVSEILIKKIGSCTQFSALFIAMCRILKVPARIISGYIMRIDQSNGEGDSVSAHDVVEIYDNNKKRWFYVEPQAFIPFGLVTSWDNYSMIIYQTELMKNPQGLISITYLLVTETKHLREKQRISYKIIQ